MKIRHTIIYRVIDKLLRILYNRSKPKKIRRLAGKEEIVVLFILNDVSKWKSEKLYLEMVNNSKFKPILGITYRNGDSLSSYSEKVVQLERYLNNKKYPYIELNNKIKPNPDIVIYTEPYASTVPFNQSAYLYWDSLFINIPYSSHTAHLNIDYYARMHHMAWIDCYESKVALEDAYKYIGHNRPSLRLTGLPIFDILLDKTKVNPWKKQSKIVKKIIWAPHHSLGGFLNETIIYGNFLQMYDLMIEIALLYKDKVQIAFKPHPLLKEKLIKLWGAQATDDYYRKWDNLPNGQLETGDYVDLFKTSDALIHDSSSFIVEYQILNKPTLFVVRDEEAICKDLNRFGRQFFYAQRLAYNKEDIIEFVNDVINDVDIKHEERESIIYNDMKGLKGKSACQNIIDLILSECNQN